MKKGFSKLQTIKCILFIPLCVFIIFNYLTTKGNTWLTAFVLFIVTILSDLFISKIIDSQKYSHSRYSVPQNPDVDSILAVLKDKNEELEAFKATSEILSSTMDIKVITEHIYNILKRFTGCDRFLVSFLDKETQSLVYEYEFGETMIGEVGKVVSDHSIIKECYFSKQAIIQENVLIHSRNTYGDKMAIPLNQSKELFGVVFIETAKPAAFSNVNINFIESLANYAAVAIKNAEQFENIYSQKQEIEALYEEAAAVNEELACYINGLDEAKEELKVKNEQLNDLYNSIQTGYIQTVMALANAIEVNDSYTRGHCQRVMEISCEIAKRMNFSEEEIINLKYSAILHDIGKIGIPTGILNKNGKLTDEEYNEIKKHPMIAYNILNEVSFIGRGLEGILQHHERFDGSGYPNGLKGNEICKFARILCIADAFDAMTSDRPYRKGMPIQIALDEIKNYSGTQFDPEIVQLFSDMIYQIAEI